jgi:hypothetical protein
MGKRSKASWCGEGKIAHALVQVSGKEPEKKVILATLECIFPVLSSMFSVHVMVVDFKRNRCKFLIVTVSSYKLKAIYRAL